MKFKVGDKIRGISNEYGITNKDMYLGEVKEVNKDFIRILVLRHKHSNEIGSIYTAYFPKGEFEILKSKKRKFFKKLPNDFTGTLEVENGYIVEKEILDDVEKEYLSAVIKPFKDKVEYIRKSDNWIGEYINIKIAKDSTIVLPYFDKNTMYEGMEVRKEYTLEELGLDE